MVRYYLIREEVTVKIYTKQGSSQQTIVIKNGLYNKKIYGTLVIDNECVMLDGEEMNILATDAKAIIIETKPIIKKIADLLGCAGIYEIQGISSIPEGREREILQSLLEN